jgi:uncharacterized protein YukE
VKLERGQAPSAAELTELRAQWEQESVNRHQSTVLALIDQVESLRDAIQRCQANYLSLLQIYNDDHDCRSAERNH